MKTKKITVSTTSTETTKKEQDVVDKDHYIKKYIEKAKQDKKSIIVEVSGGCVQEVYNLPEGFTYTLIDWDNYEGMSDEEFIEEMGLLLDEYRLGSEEDNYRWILINIFKNDRKRYQSWLEKGEPRNDDGTVIG